SPFAFANTMHGQRDREATLDTYGQFLTRLHATFLYGGVVNGDGDWFKVVASGGRDDGEPDPEILRFCDDTRDRLAEVVMSESTGFTEQFFAMLQERTAFGNGVLYAGDRPGGLPVVRCAPMADVAWEGGAGHEPGAYWWRQRLTAAEWARKFPERKLGEAITTAAASPSRRNEPFTFIHGCMANPGWAPTVADQEPPKRRYLSVWLNEQEKHLVTHNFLTSDPYTAFRCPRRANELYGRGPADEAMEEAAMAQRVRAVVIRGMEKAIDPVMLLPDDGVVSTVTNESEGAMVVRAEMMSRPGDPIRYLKHEGRPDIGQEWLSTGIYGAMDRAFGRDVMSLPREPRMVESQIIGLQEEQSRGVVPLLSPLFAPTARLLARIYDICKRQGRMPKLPHTDRQYTLSIEFRNPLEKAARLAEVRALMQAMTIQAQGMQIDPGARHALKVVKGVQDAARTLGVPEKLIMTDKEITEALEAAAQVQ
ncbi:MAG: portal protein, partial [Hyphomicrobium sp.]|nr:portal protein [Hyphomicrobium sp.]